MCYDPISPAFQIQVPCPLYVEPAASSLWYIEENGRRQKTRKLEKDAAACKADIRWPKLLKLGWAEECSVWSHTRIRNEDTRIGVVGDMPRPIHQMIQRGEFPRS